MLRYAAHNLLKERVRLLVSVGGVAFAVMLIVLLRGLFVAYQTKVEDYFASVDADLWVVQEGTADFFHSFSILSTDLEQDLAAIDGVETVRPYVARQVAFELDGEQTLFYLVGFDPADPVTGPVRLADGRLDIGDDGLIVDRVFADEHGLDVGDPVTVDEVELRVQGISSGGDLVMFTYAYATMDTARQILELPTFDNAVLLDLGDGADPGAVAAAIESRVPGLSVRDTDEMIRTNQRPINDSFLPVIGVLLVIGFFVGVAVIGLTIYSAVLEKRREYGVLKALGAHTRQLVATVGGQALLAALGGYAAGIGLAFGVRAATARWVPEFVAEIALADLAWVALAAAGMAITASVIPLARIVRIDPAEVFRA